MEKETIKTVNLNRASTMRDKIKMLCGYTDERLNELMFEMAVTYMQDLGMSEDWLAVWLKEPLFWSWWRQQWTLLDELFYFRFHRNKGKESLIPALRNKYQELHSSIDRFPDDIVFEKIQNSYAEVSGKIMRKIIANKENL